MDKLLFSLGVAIWFSAIHLPSTIRSDNAKIPIFFAKCGESTYTVVKNSVYDGAKVIYRIPPGTKYHLQGCTIYYGNKAAFNILTKKRFIASYRKKRKIPDRVLYVENGKLVKVSQGQVYIGDFKAYRDADLKKGIAHVYHKDGNLYINDNIVMKKNPSKPKIKIPAVVNLNLRDVTEFQLKMRKSFILQYKDKKREQVFMSVPQ